MKNRAKQNVSRWAAYATLAAMFCECSAVLGDEPTTRPAAGVSNTVMPMVLDTAGPTTAPAPSDASVALKRLPLLPSAAAAPTPPPLDQVVEPRLAPFHKPSGISLGNGLQFRFGAAVKETYDTNVYLQDTTKLGNRSSTVTTLIPSAEAEWKQPGGGNADAVFNYSPELNYYSSVSSEDFVRHPLTAKLSDKFDNFSFESLSNVVFVDGPRTGPTYTGPGGAPADGGYQVRDRRDQTVYRENLKVQYDQDPWFVRPVFSLFDQDFHTELKKVKGYSNYISRSDINGGADAGYKVFEKTYLTLGYRYGQQTQEAFLSNRLQYSNDYQRVLFGIEAQPTTWLKLTAAGGPDFRHFSKDVAVGFERDQVQPYYNVSAVITPTTNDEILLVAGQFMNVAAGGRSAYIDLTYSAAYKHKFSEHLSAGIAMRAYSNDFTPIKRQDWLLTPSVNVTYTFNDNISAMAAWSLDDGESALPQTSGREFHRQLMTLGMKFDL